MDVVQYTRCQVNHGVAGRLWRVVLRAGEVLRNEGPRSLLFKILGETVYRRAYLMERRLPAPRVDVTPDMVVDIRVLKPCDAEAYAAFCPLLNPCEVRRRLEAGQVCITARLNGHIVHGTWVSFGTAPMSYLRRSLPLAPKVAYVYEVFTAPAWRGHGIAPTVLNVILRALAAEGYERVVSIFMPENRPAFSSPRRLGFRRLGVLGYVQFGPWRRHFWRPDVGERDSASYWGAVADSARRPAGYLDDFLGGLKRQAHLRLVEQWGRIPTDGRVLKTDLFEEAMGAAAFLRDLTAKGTPVVGMDISPAVVAQAKYRGQMAGAHGVVADVRRLPFAAGVFELIISPSTLDHFVDASDLGRSLRELRRALKRMGRLIITVDNRQNVCDPLLRCLSWLRLTPYWLGRSYTAGELDRALRDAGFETRALTAILPNPRLAAVGAIALAGWLRWPAWTRVTQRVLLAAQKLEGTRWRYWLGSFVAALAAPADEERDTAA